MPRYFETDSAAEREDSKIAERELCRMKAERPTVPTGPMTEEKWAALESAHKAATPEPWEPREGNGDLDGKPTALGCLHAPGTTNEAIAEFFPDWAFESRKVHPRRHQQNLLLVSLARNLLSAILAYHKHAQDALNYSYQLAGAVGAGVEALDNLSAVVHGEAPPHPWPVAESAELQRAEEIRAVAVKVHEVSYRRAPGYFTEVECRVLDKLRAASGVK